MGLTIFTYLSTAIIIIMAFRIRSRGRKRDVAIYRIAALCTAIYGGLQASGYLLAADYTDTALTLIRWAGAFASFSYLAFFRLSLTFPYGRKLAGVDVLLFVLAGLSAWRFAGTGDYLESVRRVLLEFIRFEGPRFKLYGMLSAGLGLVSAVILWIRALLIKSRVYRQQAFLMSAGIIASVLYGYMVSLYLPSGGATTIYPIGSLGGLLAVLAAAYAFSSTRLFHLPSLSKTLASQMAMIAVFGIPLALLAGILLQFRLSIPVVLVTLSIAAFLLLGRGADRFASKRFGAARNEEAREEIEADIAHLDLSLGREAVLASLSTILSERFGSLWFWMLSEDDAGGLVRVFPGEEESTVVGAGSPVLEPLTSLERQVILKTDVVADPAFAAHKAILLEFFDALGAEAIILAKEGRRIIGLFALGPKRSGADYSALDYDAFMAIQGKLFVVAYYVRHVARESLLATVEKEIGLADQIVRAVQETIDPIRYPGVDVSYICQSTRQLGGDLYDSVKISEHRWFFVVGDVSGKGLNAAMSMVILKSMIRTLLREEKDFVKLVSRTNAFIKEQLPRGTFFAGVFGFLALDKGSVYFINCGIPAVFFKSPGLDTVIEVQGEGKMLGFVRNLEPYLKTRKLALPAGSSLVITTDGIVEAENVRGERYGKERMVRILAENKGANANDTIDAIIKSATAFTDGKLEDDVTVLAINYSGRKGGTA
ncbi:MAG TPA: SpoIIE family protein phosphatase [Spirochaetales bacterium]|nr:SpoIIE family protein phosphatase [Spirochaetales bacterium]